MVGSGRHARGVITTPMVASDVFRTRAVGQPNLAVRRRVLDGSTLPASQPTPSRKTGKKQRFGPMRELYVNPASC